MRINVYAEEITNRVEIVEKTVGGRVFTGLRFYLYLPVTMHPYAIQDEIKDQISGPFIHHKDDDDSAAVTFWGKYKLKIALQTALDLLDGVEEK